MSNAKFVKAFVAGLPIGAAIGLALLISNAAMAVPHRDTDGDPLANVYSTIDAPFSGVVAMTVATTYAAQRSVGAYCTSAGVMTLTLSDASSIVLPLAVGWQTFPFAATAVASATGTCTFSNLK